MFLLSGGRGAGGCHPVPSVEVCRTDCALRQRGPRVALAGAAPAVAAPVVSITTVYVDSPGSDTGRNTSLNAEYVTITNSSRKARVLTGWTLKDKTGYTFRFSTFTLRAKASVRVHTGKGTRSATHQYFGRSWYVWNNTGDTATLRDTSGKVADTCTWERVSSKTAC